MENTAVYRNPCKLFPVAHHSRKTLWHHGDCNCPQQYCIFYELYQIDTNTEADEAEGGKSEPGHHRGLNSLWGSLWSVCTATGWTLDYLIWGIAWINLQMMITDAPRYVSGQKTEEINEPDDIAEIEQLLKL